VKGYFSVHSVNVAHIKLNEARFQGILYYQIGIRAFIRHSVRLTDSNDVRSIPQANCTRATNARVGLTKQRTSISIRCNAWTCNVTDRALNYESAVIYSNSARETRRSRSDYGMKVNARIRARVLIEHTSERRRNRETKRRNMKQTKRTKGKRGGAENLCKAARRMPRRGKTSGRRTMSLSILAVRIAGRSYLRVSLFLSFFPPRYGHFRYGMRGVCSQRRREREMKGGPTVGSIEIFNADSLSALSWIIVPLAGYKERAGSKLKAHRG